jgi:hypothetical protein
MGEGKKEEELFVFFFLCFLRERFVCIRVLKSMSLLRINAPEQRDKSL